MNTAPQGVSMARKLVVRSLCFAATFGLAWAGFVDEARTDVEQLEMTGAKLREEWLNKKRAAISADAIRAQLREMEAASAEAAKRLPVKFDQPYSGVLELARAHGLRVERMQVAEGETRAEFYASLPASFALTGTFRALGGFVGAVAASPGTTVLRDLKLEALDTPGQLTMEASARTFRYITDEEAAEQRKAAASKKGKGKK